MMIARCYLLCTHVLRVGSLSVFELKRPNGFQTGQSSLFVSKLMPDVICFALKCMQFVREFINLQLTSETYWKGRVNLMTEMI